MNIKNLPPSLIILKNSTEANAIPSPEELEIGEIALSLFPGQEAIWLKNSEGDIKDLRKTSSETLWKDCFKSYPSRSAFENDLNDGKVGQEDICFIALEKQIWALGEFYGSEFDPKDLDEIVSQRLVTIPYAVSKLDPESSASNDIEEAWNSIEGFKSVVIAVVNNTVLASISSPKEGTIPVSTSGNIVDSDNMSLKLEWILGGEYYYMITVLSEDGLEITKYSRTSLGESMKEIQLIKNRLSNVENQFCWIEAN